MRALISICMLLLLPAAVGAAADTGRMRLERFLADLTRLTAQFEQRVFDEYGDLLETSRGRVALEKPGKFRWEYVDPYAQIIVTDGTTLWVYDVDLEQVSMNAIADVEANSPAELLVGEVQLDAHYAIEELEPAADVTWVRLTPKNDEAQYNAVEIGLDGDGIHGMRLRDNLRQLTEITFTGTANDADIGADEFTLVPPPGVDVISGAHAPTGIGD